MVTAMTRDTARVFPGNHRAINWPWLLFWSLAIAIWGVGLWLIF
jgi:hypothetical protein